MPDHDNQRSDSNYYKSTGSLEKLPDEVQAELQAHLQQYLRDPVAAHLWDPVVIGVPGGAVKTLLLNCVGRKSGKRINNVVQYYKMDGKICIVASRGGTEEHPSWYLNLLAQPRCDVQLSGSSSPATARTLEGEERKRWWEMITREQPIQATYQGRTSRIIPVIMLEFDLPRSVIAASV